VLTIGKGLLLLCDVLNYASTFRSSTVEENDIIAEFAEIFGRNIRLRAMQNSAESTLRYLAHIREYVIEFEIEFENILGFLLEVS
jgi:hypothetical protein